MNFFKQASFNNTLVILLIAINIVCLFFLLTPPHSGHRMDRERMGRHSSHEHFLAKKLKFDKKQKRQFKALNQAHHQEMRTLIAQKEALSTQLMSEVSNDEYDFQIICDSIGLLNAQEKRNMFVHFREVRTICNDEQKVDFDKFLKKIRHKMYKRSFEKQKPKNKKNSPQSH